MGLNDPGSISVTSLDLIQVMGAAERLKEQHQTHEAADLYRRWLSVSRDPVQAAVAWFNLATMVSEWDRAQAMNAYEIALALHPSLYQAALNLGLCYEALGQSEQAIRLWEEQLQRTETQTLLLNHMGRVYEQAQDYAKAERCFFQSLALEVEQSDVVQHYLHARARQCRWPVVPDWLREAWPGGRPELCCGPFLALALLSDPADQQAAVCHFIARKTPQDITRFDWANKPRRPGRWRIGYFSGDFTAHAVSLLMAEVLELHDRNRFEIFGLDYSPVESNSVRERVLAAFDVHVPLQHLSDEAAAAEIRARDLDVLIDLTGLTRGSRWPVLLYKPARVQVNYLGFMGTSCIETMDHVLVDAHIFPPHLAANFNEVPLFLPSYQANDRQRRIGPPPSRAQFGLPEHAVVLCAFNNNYKITPEVWARWMRILQAAPRAVLWVLEDNPYSKAELIARAQESGIELERLFFAGRVSPDAYLARYVCADLFLDTEPYGAGTTASDALWAGTPVLTCPGSSMVSRMAGSLLHNVGLTELITRNAQDYEDKAIDLAQNPEKLTALRNILHHEKDCCVLFDSPRFVSHLERILLELVV